MFGEAGPTFPRQSALAFPQPQLMNSCETTSLHLHREGGSLFSWRRLAVVACAVYWMLLLTGTHLPRLPQPVRLSNGIDKMCHFIAFAGLAILLSLVCRFWSRRGKAVSFRSYLTIVILAAAYGTFDELTQPLVGRTCELGDWIADISGAVFGCAVFATLQLLVRRGADSESTPAASAW